MLIVSRAAGNQFSTHDVRLLRAFGTQASVLLERSMLYEEVAAGAILQERSRLAREIHDGLAQHLAFLKMRVAWLQRSSKSDDTSQLKDIESVLETALIEARHAITTLRAEPEGTSTAEAIDAYAQEFGQVSGLTVEVTSDSDVADVGPKTRVELLRVVQEALNNVRKHAQASNVSITILPDGTGMAVTIKDDGKGFSSDQNLNGHFGLEIMRERAESVGGSLDVRSFPDAGTQVCIWVPTHDAGSEVAEEDWVGSPSV
jgi:two-component system nitrate/nitrite sensor histidine kinase NarX